jgi:hypothetical protein
MALVMMLLPNKLMAQSINDPYCISEFASFSDKVTEMTVDWDNDYLYFTGENVFGRLYRVDSNGNAVRISSNFANSAGPGLLHNYISTDIVYYNDSIFTNSEGSLIMVDLSPSVTSSVPYVFSGDIGAEAGMAVVGDKIYTTDGKGSSNSIYEYDIASNTARVVVSGLPADTLHGLEYCEATNKLYLAISPLGIYEVDIAAGTYTLVTDPLPNTSRSNFAIDPTGTYAYVHNGSTVHRYNLSTGVGEVFASGLLASNFCDLKFGPSSGDPSKYSLYIGGNDRIYEATGFVPATSADTPTLVATQSVICPLGAQTTVISVSPEDKLNGASAWYLYSGSCGGTLLASNTNGSFTVEPSQTTTYYVRGEGECNVTPGECGSITIIYGDIQPPITSLTHVSCYGESNGEIEVFASGGSSPYKYSIDNGLNFQSENLFTGLAAGDYNVVVSESNGCTNISQVSLTEPDPLELDYNKTDVSCHQGDDGLIEISASGGVGSGYEYSIDGGSSWKTTNTFSGLVAGSYFVMIRDRVYNYPLHGEKRVAATTCETDPVEVVIEEPTAISFSNTQTEVSCNGGNDGSITFSAEGGVGGAGSGTYQYSIDGGISWQESATFTGLTAGDYSPAVQDKVSTSCVVTGDVITISEPTKISFTTEQTNISCHGGNEGEIVVTATGGEGGAGTATYEYSFDGGENWQQENTYSNLVAGDYQLVVRDQGHTACQTDIQTISITEPTALAFTVDQQNISCNGNNSGQITVNASGGVGGNGSGTYEYSNDGGSNWQAENVFSDLYAGSYNVRIRDKENPFCSSEISAVNITQADPLSFTSSQTNVGCFGGNDGAITITAQGGSGSGYDYSDDGGLNWQASNLFENLSAGDFEVLIRDQADINCQSDSKTIRIEEPNEITFAITQNNVSCNGGNDGAITVTAEGGVGGAGSGTYQYSMDNGASWQDENSFENLEKGTYSISVRDAVNNSCQTDGLEVVITEPSKINIEISQTNISCFGGSNGEIEITATGGEGGGGSGIFAYSIDGGLNWQSLNIFSNLIAGNYTVVVRDQGNVDCTTDAVDVEILQPTPISFTSSIVNVSCNGSASGEISINASGGVGGAGSGTYQYSNDGGYSWQDSNVFTNLFAGNYSLSVRDKVNQNCATEISEVTVSEFDALSFTFEQQDVSCFGVDDGQIIFTASGGSGEGYQYSIDGGLSFQASNTFSGLSPDRYNLVIAEKDNPDCQSEIQRTSITEPTAITFTSGKVDVSCYGCNNGVISISASGGDGGAGTGEYQYSIDGGENWQDLAVFTGLYAGTYQLMVRDKSQTGCEIGPEEVVLKEPTPLTFTTTHSNINCHGDASGEIQIFAEGGVGGAGSGTYQYSINDGEIWEDFNVFSGLAAGVYQVKVRDKVNINNVTDAQSVEITEPTALTFTFNSVDVSCNGDNNGSITVDASGGIGGNGSGTYDYSIDGENWQKSNVFESLYSGDYNISIRDAVAVSCVSESQALSITEPTLLELSFEKVDANCSTNDDGEIHLTATGGSGGSASGTLEYSIDNENWQDSSDFTGLSSGDYLVTARDKENPGCQTDPQAVFVDLVSPINVDYTFNEISCNGSNDGRIELTANGGSGYEYSIDNTNWQDNGLFENLPAGDYSLITREKTNPLCASETIALSLGEPSALSFTTAIANATCLDGNDGEIAVSAEGGEGGAGSATYSYSIDNGGTWQDADLFTNLSPADYDVLIRDKVNTACQSPAQTVTVHQYSSVGVEITSTNVSCYEGNDGSIRVTASGGDNYEYSIDNAATWVSTNVFEGLVAGKYTVVVREQALPDCYTEPQVVEIEQPTEITFSVEQHNVSCFASSDGTILVNASGGEGGAGTATYEYSNDNGSTWQTSNSFTDLIAGTYQIVLRDLGAPTCQTAPLDVDITQPEALSISINQTNLSCFSSGDGQVEVILSGGTGGGASGNFEYTIDGGINWQDSNIFTGLAAGTYQVSVRDKNHQSCQVDSDDILITEPEELTFTTSVSQADCGVDNNGEIDITAQGGSGNYQYSIDNGSIWTDNNKFAELSPDTYTAVVRDKENTACLSASQEIKIISLSPINYTFTSSDVSCPSNQDGEIVIDAEAGPTYDYSIDDGENWQTSNTFSNLKGGSYVLRVRDQASPTCMSESTPVEIFEAEALTFTYILRDESCNAISDGQIYITASGGASGSYDYSIDGGITWSSTSEFNNLKAGNYGLIIRDKENVTCTSDQQNVSLKKSTELGFDMELTPVSCDGSNDGQIKVVLTSGSLSATYEYSIDMGGNWQTSDTFSDLSAGDYLVGIREQGSTDCQPGFQPISLNNPDPITIRIQKQDVSCETVNTGQISISASADDCEYTIDGGLNFQDSDVFDGLGVGSYEVYARKKDNVDCISDIQMVDIEKRDDVEFVVSKTDISCNSSVDGEIHVSFDGGISTADYEYSISNGNSWQASPDFVGLEAGEYNVVVQKPGQNGCMSYPELTEIIEPNPISFETTVTNESCSGIGDGQIEITAEGGSTAVYDYSINNGGEWQSDGVFKDLSANTYFVLVRDHTFTDCLSSVSEVTVEKEQAIDFTVEIQDVACFGSADGALTVEVANQSGAVYEYSIDGTNWQTENVFSGLTSGKYSVLVRGQGGISCQTVQEVTISQPDLINFTVEKTDLTCASKIDGSLSIKASGGASGTYQYSIDNGSNWQDELLFSNLDARTYFVIVRDKANISCESNPQSITIDAPAPLSLSVSKLDLWCNSSQDGQITASGSGGDGNLLYSIDGGLTYVDNGGIFSGLAAGEYNVYVKDGGGCELAYADNPVVLDEPQGVVFREVTIDYGRCDGGLGSINIDAASVSGPITYSIDGGNSYSENNYFGDLNSGVYTIMAKETDGCENSYDENPVMLTLASELSVKISATPEDNICTNYPIKLEANGPDIAEYHWSTGEETSSIIFNSDSPGSYDFSVNVVSTHGCDASDNLTLNLNAGSPINIFVSPNDTACAKDVISLSASAENAVSYLWKPDNVLSNSLDVQKDDAGQFTYFVEVTNNTGCISLDSVQLVIENCTGLNELDADGVKIRIFPNPSHNGQFKVEIDGLNKDVEVSIIDFNGRVILEDKIPYKNAFKLQKEFNIQGFERGVYFIRMATDEKVSYKRLILM